MDDLVNDITPLIPDFLSPSDAINFSRTCSKLHSHFPLTVTRPRQIMANFSKDNCDYDRHYGFKIPVLSQAPVHSMLISMRYGDQGWGNHKGRVFIVATKNQSDRPGHDQCRSRFSDQERVVFSSGIAPHRLQRITIIFRPRQNESYHLWYIVGGGGGHSIRLENVRIQTLAFDDPAHNLKKAHDFLMKNNTFPPWDAISHHTSQKSDRLSDSQLMPHQTCQVLNTILESTSYSLTNGLQVLPPMVSFFKSCGISEQKLSLKLVTSIKSLCNDWEKELSDYNQAHHTDDKEANDYVEQFDYGPDDPSAVFDATEGELNHNHHTNFSLFRFGRRREGRRQVVRSSWRRFLLRRRRSPKPTR